MYSQDKLLDCINASSKTL